MKNIKKNQFDGYLVYGTRAFNKTTGRGHHADKSLELQNKYFINPKTSLLYKHIAERRVCPICQNKKYIRLFLKNGAYHVRCSKCRFVYINPTIKDKYRDFFFSKIYNSWTEVLLNRAQKKLDASKYKYGLKIINRYSKSKRLLVDIGAGCGLFLKIARDNGWRVSGIEFNSHALKSIEKLGIQVFNKPLNLGVYAEESIDVVTIWEVLEHINNPSIFLQDIFKILKPEGLLFICVPNINALITRILHEKSHTFDGCSHVNFFSEETLSQLIKKIGFKVLETETAISELGSIRNYLSYEDPYYGNNEDSGLNFLTPEYIYKNNLGSRIFMLCRKKKV